MATPVEPVRREVFTSGEAQAVDVRGIERELLRLWKSAVEAGDNRVIAPVTRAALLTLVGVVRGDAAAAEATAVIARVTEHSPCRAILVNRLEDGAGPPLEALASAHCHRVGRGKQVCCEQITIAARPQGLALLPGLIRPLLLPDLPVYLYWPEALVEAAPGQLFDDLVHSADYVVVDTARAVDPVTALERLAGMANARPRVAHPRDLNWARLLPWREALADLFEPADRRAWLGEVARVAIRSAGGSMPCQDVGWPARPMLFAAWIHNRLGWRRRSAAGAAGRITIGCEDGRQCLISLDEPDDPRGRLGGVDLALADGRGVSVERVSPGAFLCRVLAAGGEARETHVLRRSESEDLLLCQELDDRGTDPLFQSALEEAAALSRALRALVPSGGGAA